MYWLSDGKTHMAFRFFNGRFFHLYANVRNGGIMFVYVGFPIRQQVKLER